MGLGIALDRCGLTGSDGGMTSRQLTYVLSSVFTQYATVPQSQHVAQNAALQARLAEALVEREAEPEELHRA